MVYNLSGVGVLPRADPDADDKYGRPAEGRNPRADWEMP